MDLEKLEETLIARGLSPSVRKSIRNAKIGIIDDQITDLKSFVEGLKTEGFTNLVEKSRVSSINELLESGFDLIVLDLSGVAGDLFADDGVAVLSQLKSSAPWLPVLVVSGSRPSVESTRVINQADAIRDKPLLPSDLATEVEDLLKYRKDAHWGGLAVLSELKKLNPAIQETLGYWARVRLWYNQVMLVRSIP